MEIVERFLNYVKFETTSDPDSTTYPSSEKESVLLEYIRDEMKASGFSGVEMDEYGYVYGYLPASEGCENADPIGFLAHVDVSDAASGANIKPNRIKYTGGDIVLNPKVKITEEGFPFLREYVGQELITTDGTTLLGADDKAGIAEILDACEYMMAHPEIKHGKICVAFTPDEEIGRGVEYFDIKKFGAKYAYTVDGGMLGELEYECFNAAGVTLTINGVAVHPGTAKNKMKNSIMYAMEFISMFPPADRPEHTEGYEGFYHVDDISGNELKTVVKMIVRDHDMAKFNERKDFVRKTVDYLNEKYGEGTFELEMSDTYYNMREEIEKVMYVVERAKKGFELAGIEAKTVPVRGGTDGAGLTAKGLPCPNLSTGGENYHGVLEFVSVDAMRKMSEVIVNIASCIQY